ncbi:hypothetical protein AVEN_195117-1 [Araneus ventricosus]|uniref:Uncharacterized protein n=1 Tax=Araneus ventricosus TaxID=182803 RepID=A0A4Y2BIZ8_ARAVE|nr:hypothetical protein AVEN_195117-1 [Araneus ventricosus]
MLELQNPKIPRGVASANRRGMRTSKEPEDKEKQIKDSYPHRCDRQRKRKGNRENQNPFPYILTPGLRRRGAFVSYFFLSGEGLPPDETEIRYHTDGEEQEDTGWSRGLNEVEDSRRMHRD